MKFGAQLEQQRAELRAERRGRLEELPHRVGAVAQPPIVRDPLRRLQRELVAIRRGLVPAVENLLVRRAVEGVVDLDGREPLGVVRQHLRRRHRLRIEAALPLGIVVAGRTDPDGHAQAILAHLIERAKRRRLAVHQQADLEDLGGEPHGGHGRRHADHEAQHDLPERGRRRRRQPNHHREGVHRRDQAHRDAERRSRVASDRLRRRTTAPSAPA